MVKICSVCGCVQRYNRGDNLPHWGKWTPEEKQEADRLGYNTHHTICPDCRQNRG
jgi:transcription initiation factor TFIIIB Brf1 subunit/transcription initiation factor TFIIB